jgi:adenylate cyclase
MVAGVAAAAGLGVDATGVLHQFELSTVDTRFEVRGEQPLPPHLVLVALDDQTYERFDEYPLKRHRYADALDQIRRGHPKAVGIDVQFTEQTDAEEDNALIEGIMRAPGTVLSTTESDPDHPGNHTVLGGPRYVKRFRAVIGVALFPLDDDGVVRRSHARVDGLPTFAYALAAAARGGRPPQVPQDPSWIDYHGASGRVRQYSLIDVAKGRVRPGAFRDAIVVIGSTTATGQDFSPTPFDPSMPGPEVQLTATHTYLEGTPLRAVSGAVDKGLIVLLALVGPLLAWAVRRAAIGRAIGIGVGMLLVGAAQLLFNAGWIVAVAVPMLTYAVGLVGALAVDLVTSAFERERLYDLFSRFVPDQVVAEVVAQAEDGVRLGGTARIATVMFCDLRGFTTFSEGRPPEQVIDIVNAYLGEMSEAILDHGGTLVAYMGDGIFAVFGAPLDQPDHADRALAAAKEMVSLRLPRFNARLADEPGGGHFRMGIGLNTGTVISGNVGSERRLEYAAIGDTTNTAARIEGLTKGTSHQILLSDATRAALLEPPAALLDAGEVEVRGKTGRVRLWSVPEGTDPQDQREDLAARSESPPELV